MKSAEPKISSANTHIQKKVNQPFFSKGGEGTYFSRSNEASPSFFNPNTIQTKCSHCEEEKKLQKKEDARLSENELELQPKMIASTGGKLPSVQLQTEEEEEPDRFDLLHPSRTPRELLESINPSIMENMQRYCSQNCPATAAALYNYLQTGDITEAHCSPMMERQRGFGYSVPAATASFERWTGPGRNAWRFIRSHTEEHGSFVVVEGDRVTPPAGLTRYHYFIILNIRGSRFVVDAYTHQVTADITGYLRDLGTRSYSVYTGSFTASPVVVQPKLTMGQPNDKYEVEADTMADKVIQKLSKNNNHSASERVGGNFVSKKENSFGRGISPIQLKSKKFNDKANEDLQNQLNSNSGGGSPLSPAIQNSMGSAFGADFSEVRIHTNSTAVQMNKELNAQAFTHGNDIYFNQAKYAPTTTNGKHLLAHELTHTVQQGVVRKDESDKIPGIQKLGDTTQVPATMSCSVATNSPGGVTDITFGTSSSTIPPAQRGMLDGFVRGWHAGGGTMNIRLDGYASTDGPDALNWQLSCDRANAVRAELENPSDGSPGISAGFIEIFAQGETSEFGASLALNRKVVLSSVARPVPLPAFRTVTTDFGTYDVFPDIFIGPLLPNQLREADLQRLQSAWDRMVANTGGMITNGTVGDRQSLRTIFGREIARSITFRNLFLEIMEDPAHPVIINVGRNNASWVDAFATNAVDLNDIEVFEESPRPGYEWVQTQGEIVIHWLSERRFAAVNGRADFGPAHEHPLEAGGDQENFRRDIGQTGRIVSQVRVNLGGGLHEGVYTDDSGNIMRIRRDDSGGDPVPYEIVYQPAAGAAVPAQHTRTNSMSAQVNSNAAAVENLYVQYIAAGRTANTAPLPINAGNSQQFNAALRNLVPAGATIQVRIFRRNAVGADTQIARLNWTHPFANANVQVNLGGTIYNLNASLNMSN